MPFFKGTKTAGYNRMRFLLESLQDLDESLKKYGGRLYIFHGDPVKILSGLFTVSIIAMVCLANDFHFHVFDAILLYMLMTE